MSRKNNPLTPLSTLASDALSLLRTAMSISHGNESLCFKSRRWSTSLVWDLEVWFWKPFTGSCERPYLNKMTKLSGNIFESDDPQGIKHTSIFPFPHCKAYNYLCNQVKHSKCNSNSKKQALFQRNCTNLFCIHWHLTDFSNLHQESCANRAIIQLEHHVFVKALLQQTLQRLRGQIHKRASLWWSMKSNKEHKKSLKSCEDPS